MPKLIKTALLLSLIALLTACASPARIAGMPASPQPSLDPNQTPLKESIRITQVSGGQETNPMWTSQVDATSFRQALEQSLRQAGFLTAQLSDAFIGTERLKLANEGAIRNNIEALIEDLYQLKPSLQ